MRVRIEAEVRPTEDVELVKEAIRNLFNVEKIEVVDRGRGWRSVIAYCEGLRCLMPLRRAILSHRVEDAFFSVLYNIAKRTPKGSPLVFRLNKQAALVGVPSLAEEDVESPMGPIVVEIESEDHVGVIKWLTGKE